MKSFSLILFFLFTIATASSNTYVVPGAYSTIQAAINACNSFDTVLVSPGIYHENIVLWSNRIGIRLLSTMGPNQTTIDGGSVNRVIRIDGNSIQDSLIVIRGFTIQNGKFHAPLFTHNIVGGAGISISHANVLLDSMIITNNNLIGTDHSFGCGVFADTSALTITNSEISKNTILNGNWSFGAGVCATWSVLRIDHCNLIFNESHSTGWNYGAGICSLYGSMHLNSSRISNNYLHSGSNYNFGGGIYFNSEGSDGDIINCLISDNIVDTTMQWHNGGGIYAAGKLYNTIGTLNIIHSTITANTSGFNSDANSLSIKLGLLIGPQLIVNIINSILWSNCSSEIDTSGVQLTIQNSDIRYSTFGGQNCISTDPMFVGSSDYRLSAASPCINKGVPLINIDIDNSIRPAPANHLPDLGCFEIDESAVGIEKEELKELLIESTTSELIKIRFEKGYFKMYTLSGALVLNKPIDCVEDTYINTFNLPLQIYLLEFISLDNKRYSTLFPVEIRN